MTNEERLSAIQCQIDDAGLRAFDQPGYCSWEAQWVIDILGGTLYEFSGPLNFRRWDPREQQLTYFQSRDRHVVALLEDGVVIDLGNRPQVYADLNEYLGSRSLIGLG